MSLTHHALLIIDVQNDFLPGGSLAVPEGDLILPNINDLTKRGFGAVIASRDWHPRNHLSFDTQGGPWPTHCVAGTIGADFPPHLETASMSLIVHKGLRPECDSYSAFFDNEHRYSTGLHALLNGLAITHLMLCGLALEVCVAATARDARSLGYNTTIALKACRALAPEDTSCLSELSRAGVTLCNA